MSKFIDIEIVVDTVTLLDAYKSPSQKYDAPTGISHTGYAYMIAQSAYVKSGQATGNLSVYAVVNDTVRWRSLSLSGNSDYSVVLYNMTHLSGASVTSIPPEAHISTPYVPLPILKDKKNTTPPTFSIAKANDYYLQASVDTQGTEQYNVFFYVTKLDATGRPTLVGYFYWDPEIVVPVL